MLVCCAACAAAQRTSRVCTQRPFSRSHCRRVLSAEPETRVLLRKLRAVISPMWAERVRRWQSAMALPWGGSSGGGGWDWEMSASEAAGVKRASLLPSSASEGEVVKVYDKADGRQWDCGAGVSWTAESGDAKPSVVERVRVKDGFLVEGRRDGGVGVWSC